VQKLLHRNFPLILTCTMTRCSGCNTTAPWPMYQHDAQHTGRSTHVAGGYPNAPTLGANDGKWYVYGFRVPLLVVSAFVNDVNSSGGYVSGNTSLGGTGLYPGEFPPYVHDFGSILGYVEHTFSLSPYDGGSSCGIAGVVTNGCDYPFADYLAPDGQYECGKSPGCGSGYLGYPLADFFGSGPRAFTTITGAKYASTCFTSSSNATGCFGSNFPSDPDDEDN
jgi:hypothetical protein